MKITITTADKQFSFECDLHCAIDKMVSAIKENVPDWVRIDIAITAARAA